MFQSKTVFVLGAGASVEFAMPLGTKLLNDVATKLGSLGSGDNETSYIARKNMEPNEFRLVTENCKRYWSGMLKCGSIDTALYNYSDEGVTKIGKLAIAHTILHYESQSYLARKEHRESWVDVLLELILATGSKFNRPHELFSNIAFVNFNYDRCLESVLKQCLLGVGYDEETAEKTVSELEIVRPYGSLGTLQKLSFGNLSHDAIRQASENIRTFTESCESNKASKIKKIIDSSKKIVFLGFGFHKQNIDLLKPPTVNEEPAFSESSVFAYLNQSPLDIGKRECVIIGTAREITEPNREKISEDLQSAFELGSIGPGPTLVDKSCASLLKDYSRVIQN